MEIKFLEIRDRGTCLPAMAINLNPNHFHGNRAPAIIKHAGYARTTNILLMRLDTAECKNDVYAWLGGTRTMPAVHHHLEKHWGDVLCGDVVDVEYILGETKEPKTPEII